MMPESTTQEATGRADREAIGPRLSEHEICPSGLLSSQEEAFARDIERLQARKGEFVKVACPACGRDSPREAFEKLGFDYNWCTGCSTLYMSPRPSEAVMTDYYENSENYAYWAEHIFPASEDARRDKIHKPWLRRIGEFASRYEVPTRSLVEVGPGFGTFCSVATESGVFESVVAVEPTPELAQACRDRGVTVVEKRIEDVGEELEPADVVVAFEVIEHLFDPGVFLRLARTIVRPGGLLVLSCPNSSGFDILELGAESLAVDAEHVNLFNPDSLSLLVESAGFETLEVTTPGRLDAEFVRDAVLAGRHQLSSPFFQKVLIDEWEEQGWEFQKYLAANRLSSHMWLVARNPT